MESNRLKRQNFSAALWLLIAASALTLAVSGIFKHWEFLKIIWEFCRRTFHWQIIYSWHFWVLGPFMILFALSLIFMAGYLIIQTARHLAVVSWIKNNWIALPWLLRHLSKEFQLSGRLVLIASKQPVVFTVGFLKPKICLSSGLLKLLSSQELRAVLLHESHHVKSYDPLKIWLLSWLKKGLWFLPFTRDFEKNFSLTRELSADRLAKEKMGTVKPLLSALFKILDSQKAANFLPSGPVAAFAAPDFGLRPDLELQAHFALATDRVNFWVDHSFSAPAEFSPKNFFLSLISLFILLGIYLAPSCRAALQPMIGQCQEVKNFTPANSSANAQTSAWASLK